MKGGTIELGLKKKVQVCQMKKKKKKGGEDALSVEELTQPKADRHIQGI